MRVEQLETNANEGSKKYFKRGKNSRRRKKGISSGNSGKPNHPIWYMQNKILAAIAGLVNFFKPIGQPVDIKQFGITDQLAQGTNRFYRGFQKNMPGIMRLAWIPTPGVAIDGNSPVNRCASKFFTALRTKQFSTSVYDPCDVMFYFLAVDSMFAFYAYLTLVYAHVKNFKFSNLYYPRGILEALNVDYNDIVNHMDELLFNINLFKSALENVRVPKSISFIARHMHMSAQVYKDHEVEKAQLYVFVPEYLYTYDATVPKLTTVAIGASANKLKYADLVSIYQSMIEKILPDEDLGIIAADVIKYIQGDYWTVNQVEWGSQLEPVYNEEMLWQIHNATFLPYTSATGLDITQRTDGNLNTVVYWDPIFTTNEGGIAAKRIIDSDKESPDAAEIIESTRLMYTVRQITGTSMTNFTFKLGACGSEILIGSKLICLDVDNVYHQYNLTTYIQSDIDNNQQSVLKFMFPVATNVVDGVTYIDYGSDLISLIVCSVFNFRPIMYVFNTKNSGDYMPVFISFAGELSNIAVIDNDQLNALHEQSLLSQFDLGSTIK